MALIYITDSSKMGDHLVILRSKSSLESNLNAGPTPCSPSTDIVGCPWANYKSDNDTQADALVPEFMGEGETLPENCDKRCHNYQELKFVNEIREMLELESLTV